jgi:beta-lactamase class A
LGITLVDPRRLLVLLTVALLALAVGTIAGWGLRDFEGVSDRAAASVSKRHNSAHDGLAGPGSPASRGTIERMSGYRLVGPLLECNLPEASASRSAPLDALRSKLAALVAERRATRQIAEAAIYVRDLTTSATVDLDAHTRFSPASLYKVPLLIAVLAEAQTHPNLMRQELVYQKAVQPTFSPRILIQRPLVDGRRYTVEALVEQLIVESDNAAAELLGANVVDEEEFDRVFDHLGLKRPQVGSLDDSLTVADYAAFFRVLYNATYLGPQASERALDLLIHARFTAGLVAGVPASVSVAHKFGERHLEDRPDAPQQLHDCGIVYRWARPYLLCVMTRGSEIPSLADFIREVSAQTWAYFK